MTNWKDKFLDKVMQGDCLELMKELPDECVDLVVTDPPYGIGESNEKNLSRGKLSTPTDYGHYNWDSTTIDPLSFDEIFRISSKQIIFGGQCYANYLKPNYGWIVWDKDNGNNDFSDCELAWTSFLGGTRKFKWRWSGMFQEDMKNKEFRSHPTQKPLALMRWCIGKYSQEGDTILDPFLGSGTTAVAAKQLGRHYIGIEINPDYCRIAEERLTQEMLF